MSRSARRPWRIALPRLASLVASPLPWLLLAAALGFYTVGRLLRATGGKLAVPLDDAFIHFQYARAVLAGTPYQYSPGAEAAAGATSLLWPALIAPFHGLGLHGDSLIWAAWILGWLALAFSAYETQRLASGLVGAIPAALAGILQVSFGANLWFASSGMEVTLFSWALARAARRSAEWAEGGSVTRLELWALALVAPLLRPEGVVASVAIALCLAIFGRGKRLAALPALLLAAGPWLLNWLGTGSGSTTARAKWLLYSPYFDYWQLLRTVASNTDYLFEVLLNGQGQAAIFLPEGSRYIALLGLVALLLLARRPGPRCRALLCLGLALSIVLPTSYDQLLGGRLRYLWPFSPGWFVGVAALVELASEALQRLVRAPHLVRAALSALLLGGLASKLGTAVNDLAVSSAGLLNQQMWLGKWAARTLPAEARIGVSDAGAIAYYSGRSVFDVVGLTTAGEARFWAAGAGSRFEHYERLPRPKLPTHFILYPGWFGLDALLGPCHAERHVPWASVLGEARMLACTADYRFLGSGSRPANLLDGELLDELDVADLESEAAHSYQLLPARRVANRLFIHGAMADGGRAERKSDQFDLELSPGGTLVMRVVVDQPLMLRVTAGGRLLGEVQLATRGWHEPRLSIPLDMPAGTQGMNVTASPPQELSSLHYWSYR